MMTYQSPPHGFRTFLALWLSQSLSVIGSALTIFATTIWLTTVRYPGPEDQRTLAFALAAVGLAFVIPAVFLAPIAGAWADRHDRKWTMIMANIASGIISLVLVALLWSHRLDLPLLLVLLVAYEIAGCFHYAAFDTSYVMLVPERMLPRANGMMQTTQSLSAMVSPALAAALISLPVLARQGVFGASAAHLLGGIVDGTLLAIAVDAMSFFVAAVILVGLTIPSPRQIQVESDSLMQPKNIWADIQLGVLYIWRRRPLIWLLAAFAVANLALSPIAVLQPLIVRFVLAPDWMARGWTFETAFALITSAMGVGGVVGGIVISVWGGLKRRRIYGVMIPMLCAGIALFSIGLSSLLYPAAVLLMIVGMAGPLLNAHAQTIWQVQTPHALQGRVFAVRRLIAQCTLPLGTAFGGLMGGVFGPSSVFVVLGGILTLFCIAQLFNPVLLRVEDKTRLDDLAARQGRQA